MTTFLLKFRNIFVFIICSFGLAIILLAAVYILNFTSEIDLEKSFAYECGFQPFSETSYPFEVQFAVIAIMFLLFDIEVLYLFRIIQSLYFLYTIDIVIIIKLFLPKIRIKVLEIKTHININMSFYYKIIFITLVIFMLSKNIENNTAQYALNLIPFIVTTKSKNINYKENLIYCLILLVLAIIPVLNSTLPFFISMLVAALIFSKPLSTFFKLKFLQKILFNILVFLHRVGFVSFVFHFFAYFFNNDLYVFKKRIIILNLIIILHAGVSRYYFINKNLNVYIFILLVIGFIAIYIRFCINMYIFINTAVTFFEENASDFNRGTPKSSSFFTKLFNFNYHRHYHKHVPLPPEKIAFSTKLAIAASVGTCLLGAAGVYKQHEANEQAAKALEQARISNEQAAKALEEARISNEHAAKALAQHQQEIQELQRQNDLEALSQGLLNKDYFCKKYPGSCNANRAQELAEAMAASKKAGMPGIKTTLKENN